MSELEGLQKLAETQKSEQAKIDGKLEMLYSELGAEGFTKLTDAKKDMELLKKKIERMKKTFNSQLHTFKKDNAGNLPEVHRR